MKKFTAIVYLICLVIFPLSMTLVVDNWIVACLATIVGLLGLLIYIREIHRIAKQYKPDGVIEIWEEDVKMIHQVEILIPPERLSKQSRVVFLVKKVRLTAPDERVSSDR